MATARKVYAKLVADHHANMLNFARWHCGHEIIGEDLLQDTVLKLWSLIVDGVVDATAVTPAYIKQGVRYTFLDHLRELQARRERHHQVGVWQSRTWDGDDPGEKVFDGETFGRARALLPGRHWEIYVLAKAYGFKPAEIGERLGLSPRTVSNYLSNARLLIEQIESVDH